MFSSYNSDSYEIEEISYEEMTEILADQNEVLKNAGAVIKPFKQKEPTQTDVEDESFLMSFAK